LTSSAASPNALVEVRGLTRHFGQAPRIVHAVEDVDFDIAPGELLGLVGESGSGKSTIGRLLLRLLPVTSGTVKFQGRDISHLSERQMRPLRGQIQMVFQDPYASLNPRLRIRDIIGEALDAHALARGRARADRIAQLLESVSLQPDHASRFPHEVSGGRTAPDRRR
jgi:peptide/nickel transport system ATP-binding protein